MRCGMVTGIAEMTTRRERDLKDVERAKMMSKWPQKSCRTDQRELDLLVFVQARAPQHLDVDVRGRPPLRRVEATEPEAPILIYSDIKKPRRYAYQPNPSSSVMWTS